MGAHIQLLQSSDSRYKDEVLTSEPPYIFFFCFFFMFIVSTRNGIPYELHIIICSWIKKLLLSSHLFFLFFVFIIQPNFTFHLSIGNCICKPRKIAHNNPRKKNTWRCGSHFPGTSNWLKGFWSEFFTQATHWGCDKICKTNPVVTLDE